MALDPMVDVSRWQAKWDKQVSSLDKQPAQVIDDHAKLFQDQISTLTREFGNMRQDIETLKHKIVAGSAMEAEDTFDRIGKVEKVIGHPNDLNSADHAWHEGCNKELSACQKQPASLEERVQFSERQIGDSADNHEKVHSAYMELQESFKGEKALWETTHSALATQIETLADSVNKHSRELEVVKGHLADAHGKVESSQGDYEEHKSLMDTRLVALETGSNEVGEKYGKEIEALNNKIRDLFGQVSWEKVVREKKLASAEERFEGMEKLITEFTQSQEKSVGALEKNSSKFHTRVDEIGHLIRSERTTREVHNSMMDERLGYLERNVSEFNDKNDKTARDIESTNSKFKEFQTRMKTDTTSRESNLSNLEEQILKLDAEMRELHEEAQHGIESLETNQKKIHSKIDDLHGNIRGEKDFRSQHHTELGEKLDMLDGLCAQSAIKHDKLLRDIEGTNSKIKEIHMRMGDDKAQQDVLQNAMSERLETLSKSVVESTDTFNCFENDIKDLRERLSNERLARDEQFMSVKQIISAEKAAREYYETNIQGLVERESKAREQCEGSLQEQLQLERSARDSIMDSVKEVLDREMKAISAMHSNQTQLIQQETHARQSSERNIMNVIVEVKEEIENNQGEMENITKLTREDREKGRSYVEEALRTQSMETQRTLQEAQTRTECIERTVGFLDTSYRKEREERIAEDRRLWQLILEIRKNDDIPNTPKATLRREIFNSVSTANAVMPLALEAPPPTSQSKPALSESSTPMQSARSPSGSMAIMPIMQAPSNAWSPAGSPKAMTRTPAPRLRSCNSDVSTAKNTFASAPMAPMASVTTLAPSTTHCTSPPTTALQQPCACDGSTTKGAFASAPMAPMTPMVASPPQQQRAAVNQVTMSPVQVPVPVTTMPAASTISPAVSNPPPARTTSRNASARGRSPFNLANKPQSARGSAASGLASPVNRPLSPTSSEAGRSTVMSPTSSDFGRSGRNSLGATQRKDRVETITCGKPRYGGKKGSSVKVPVGVREEGESTPAV